MSTTRRLRKALTPVAPSAAAAWMAARGLEALLAGISPLDGPVWGAAILLAVAMTAVGSLAPAVRATRVDPGSAIRSD